MPARQDTRVPRCSAFSYLRLPVLTAIRGGFAGIVGCPLTAVNRLKQRHSAAGRCPGRRAPLSSRTDAPMARADGGGGGRGGDRRGRGATPRAVVAGACAPRAPPPSGRAPHHPRHRPAPTGWAATAETPPSRPRSTRSRAAASSSAAPTATCPTTLPSHASLLTGVTPARHGVHENGTFVLDAARPTLGEAFQRAGYRTGAFVSAVVLDRRYGLARGFGDYVDELETDESELVVAQVTAEVTAERALSFLAQDDPRPVFTWVHFYDPHDPYAPPEPFASRFAGRAYDGEIAYMDAQVGRLLRGRGEARPPHDRGRRGGPRRVAGRAPGAHARVLRLRRHPAGPADPLLSGSAARRTGGAAARARRGRAADAAEAAQLPVPDDIDGRSLLPLVTGRSDRETGPAYQESYGPRLWWGAQEILGVRTGPWFYVRAPRPELYNVEEDPAETVNLAAERPAELERLQALLRAMVPEGDPLAHRASVDPGDRAQAAGARLPGRIGRRRDRTDRDPAGPQGRRSHPGGDRARPGPPEPPRLRARPPRVPGARARRCRARP